MIDYKEIENYEKFEDLCEQLLVTKGLKARRIGRGPGQLGKDIIAEEFVRGPLSEMEKREWLVECKFTMKGGAIDERDVQNIHDRVKAQNAYGYMLFSNARLRVNLEKTLNGLKRSSDIGIVIWTARIITEEVILHSDIFREFFPVSFSKWIRGNRQIYLGQIAQLKTPLVHVHSFLHFLRRAPSRIVSQEMKDRVLDELISEVRTLIDNLDSNLQSIRGQVTKKNILPAGSTVRKRKLVV